jgi:hypothetical protein
MKVPIALGLLNIVDYYLLSLSVFDCEVLVTIEARNNQSSYGTQTQTNMIYCPSTSLVFKDLLSFLMNYCSEEDLLWALVDRLCNYHKRAQQFY